MCNHYKVKFVPRNEEALRRALREADARLAGK
jgi:hypothetical protein